jgi:hypothetical protein
MFIGKTPNFGEKALKIQLTTVVIKILQRLSNPVVSLAAVA